MIHFSHSSLALLIVILFLSVITVTFCRSLKIPPLIGYLLVGFFASPDMLGIIQTSSRNDYLAEIGIVFMMFSIGLEFSLPKLKAMHKQVFGVGMTQVLLCTSMIMLFMLFAGQSLMSGFVVGCVLAMSSTAIISKLLTDRLELGKTHGQISIGVLLFQDIAVVPLLILLPALSSNSSTLLLDLSLALLKTFAVMLVLFLLGQRLMRPWFNLVARQRSRELFMINVLLVTLSTAYLTQLFGLSLALGAFIAGMLISETEYRYQVEEDIRPFRDILLGFFFITIGLKISPAIVFQFPFQVLMFLVILLPLKALIIYLLTSKFGYNKKASLHSALVLAHGGEFGFVLLALANNLNIISATMDQQLIAALLLSMIIAPFLVQYSEALVKRVFRNNWEEESAGLHQVLVQSMSKNEHVIICGYEQSGQALGRLLSNQEVPFVALELDPERVAEAVKIGAPIVYGDASHTEVLLAAGLLRAKALVITFSNLHAVNLTLQRVQRERPNLPVIVRLDHEDSVKILREAGAYEVVVDTMEGALMLATQAMKAVGVSDKKIIQSIKHAREERYELFQDLFSGYGEERDIDFADTRPLARMLNIPIPEGAYAIDKSLAQLKLESMSVKIKLIRRNNVCYSVFGDDWQLRSSDELILFGLPDQLALVEKFLLIGEKDVAENQLIVE